MLLIGDSYIPKSISPKPEPWGTPDALENMVDFCDPTAICWVLSVMEAGPRRCCGCWTHYEHDLSAWHGRQHQKLAICWAPTERCTDRSQRPSECRWPLSGELSRWSGLSDKLTETCSSLPTSWRAVAAWTETVFLVFWKSTEIANWSVVCRFVWWEVGFLQQMCDPSRFIPRGENAVCERQVGKPSYKWRRDVSWQLE